MVLDLVCQGRCEENPKQNNPPLTRGIVLFFRWVSLAA